MILELMDKEDEREENEGSEGEDERRVSFTHAQVRVDGDNSERGVGC